MLPECVRLELEPFIVDVRAVESLATATVTMSDGGEAECGRPASGWFLNDAPAKRGYIRLHCNVGTDPSDAWGTYVILHEFAHAVAHFQDGHRACVQTSEQHDRSELAACVQAAVWAARCDVRFATDEFARSVAEIAMEEARKYFEKWDLIADSAG